MKKFLLLLLCIATAGCVFHPRSIADFPQTLHEIYFTSVKPSSVFSSHLYDLLNSMKVTRVKSRAAARYTMAVTQDHFSYARPDIVDATLPTTIGFSQTSTIVITDNCTKKRVVKQTFSSSNTLALNTNQIYTANSNELMRQQLNNQMISFVYYWLIAKTTKDALNASAKATCKLH